MHAGPKSILIAAFVCLAFAPENARGGVTVLDTFSSWRIHNQLKPPVAEAAGGVKAYVMGVEWLDAVTAAPPKDGCWSIPCCRLRCPDAAVTPADPYSR